MSHNRIVKVIFASLLSAAISNAQEASKVPKGYSLTNGKLYISIPMGESAQPVAARARPLFDMAQPATQCANIPSAVDATATDDHLFSMSVDDAASLKIQVPIVAANGAGSLTQKVFMRQYKRYATCTAPNGDILEYGQALRGTVLYDSAQIQGDVSFPMVVANATVHNQSTEIDFQNTGFTDATVTTPHAAAMASLTNGALTVDNYGIFMGKLIESLSAADTSTNTVTAGQRVGFSPNLTLVGREVEVSPAAASLQDSLAEAFGIYYIAGGYGCLQAQDDYSKTDQHARSVVQNTYMTITKACGAPSAIDKVVAQTMLHGMKVQKPDAE